LFGTSDGAINITANSTNRPYQYSLNGGQFQADSVFTNLTAGTYTIVTLNSFNCLDTLTAIIGQPDAVVVNASPDTIFTTVGAANAITVTTQNFSSATYNWTPSSGLSCSDCNNPSATVEAPTTYVVVVSEANNPLCFGSDSVVILLGGKVAMPNAFSPNGDGRNDLFFPRAQVGEAEVKAFRIYNRWGELVHDDVTPWNGTFKNTDQPAGTYIYYVTYVEQKPTNPNVKVDTSVQGSFTLLR
jgi:gliding motility-associated-like protein